MKLKLLLLLSLSFPSIAFAQADVCKPGSWCKTWRLTVSSTVNLNGGCITTGPTGQNTVGCDTTFSTNRTLTMGLNGVISATSNGTVSGTFLRISDGTAALPGLTPASDPDTGIYSGGANTLNFSTAGVQRLSIGATGVTTTSGPLTIPTNNLFSFGGSTLYDLPSGQMNLGAPLGYSFSGVAATAFGTAASSLQVSSNDGRAYWTRATPTAQTPPVDVGGFPHPVMQRHIFGLDMGFESAVTPTFYPATPRVGAGAATVTASDAAAAGSTAIGANPLTFDARSSVTTAAAGSISSMITTAFIRRATQSPRWCQKVTMSTSANIRVWLGIASALPGSSDSPATSHEAFRYSTTAGDTKWQACYGNGVGTTCVDTGVAPSTGTSTFDTLCIDCIEGGTTACVWWINGVAKLRQTSGLGAGYPLLPFYSVEARAAAAVTLYAGNSSVELY